MRSARLWIVLLAPPAVVAAVILLLVPLPLITPAGWIGLGFLALAYLAQAVLPLSAAPGRSRFLFGSSYALLAWWPLVLALVLALVFLLAPVPWKVALAIEVLLCGGTVWLLAAATAVTDRDARLEQRTRSQVQDLRLMAVTVDQLGQRADSAGLAGLCTQVAEQLRMSVVTGTAASARIESEIRTAVDAADASRDPRITEACLSRVVVLLQQRAAVIRETQ